MTHHPSLTALNAYKRTQIAKPAGSYSAEDAAKRWGMSLENARRTLSEMKAAGIVIEIKGKKLTAAGQIVPCVYYRNAKPGSKK